MRRKAFLQGGTKKAFKITVKTDNAGTSSSNQFTLPLRAGQTYNAVIDWGDGTTTTQTTSTSPTKTYSSAGTYQISITGTFPSIYFNNGGDRRKLLSIDNWGDITWLKLDYAFYGCTNMVGTFTDAPKTASVTDFSWMFRETKFNSNLTLDCTSAVSLAGMFILTPVNSTLVFNNTTSVTSFSAMFDSCTSFNKPLTLDCTGATSLSSLLIDCTSFNSTLTLNNTNNVTNFSSMLRGCSAFNKALTINCASATNMSNFLRGCSSFNSTLSLSNTNNVTNFSFFMFGCSTFNQPVTLNCASATTLTYAFRDCSALNSSFTLSNTGNVTDWSNFLCFATAFNQDISYLNVTKMNNGIDFMTGKTAANYSAANLNAIYNTWSGLSLQPNVTIHFGTIKYTAGGSAGRAILTGAPNNWIITDGGI